MKDVTCVTWIRNETFYEVPSEVEEIQNLEWALTIANSTMEWYSRGLGAETIIAGWSKPPPSAVDPLPLQVRCDFGRVARLRILELFVSHVLPVCSFEADSRTVCPWFSLPQEYQGACPFYNGVEPRWDVPLKVWKGGV